MAGTPSKSDPRVVKDFGQPRKFLRDMRAKISKNSRKRVRAGPDSSRRRCCWPSRPVSLTGSSEQTLGNHPV